MSQPAKFRALVLNASLKHEPRASNTEEVTELVLRHMRGVAPLDAETIRLADRNIPVGLGFRESADDDWPAIVEKIKAADILILATPIWWGARSSLMQRAIERMDAFDEEAHAGGRSVLLGKVAGVVITGSEDGAQATLAGIMEVLTFMNFTLPPQCCTYWVGEVGLDPATDAGRRRANPAVDRMAQATARGLMHAAQLLRANPYPED
ncbi:MAG: NAD(P)H-dependent oxidoreductase [Bauldia sp.]|nr:NAD(P)H-dependent oxidoreductase [Bauldia sp.]